jgi:hypothetical protein
MMTPSLRWILRQPKKEEKNASDGKRSIFHLR